MTMSCQRLIWGFFVFLVLDLVSADNFETEVDHSMDDPSDSNEKRMIHFWKREDPFKIWSNVINFKHPTPNVKRLNRAFRKRW